MVDVKYEIRNLKTKDIPQLKALTDIEEWNYSEAFLEGCRRYSPGGFFVAVTAQGEVIGHCCAIQFGQSHAKLAIFVIKPALRGNGIGKRLLTKTLSFLGNRNIGLDAMPGVDVIYRKYGFNVNSFESNFLTVAPKADAVSKNANGVVIMAASDVALEKVQDYDMTLTSMSRERKAFLTHLFNFSTQSSVAVKDGEVVGYGCCQYDVTGMYIAPLYANDSKIARMLWDNLIVNMSDARGVSINMYLPNRAAVSMFESCTTVIGKPHVLKRMYTNDAVQLNDKRIFTVGNAQL